MKEQNMEQKLCLNIGSGLDYRKSNEKEKWVNIDKSDTIITDLSIDFIKKKLPFKDNSVDFAVCRNLLPHIKYKDMYKIIKEVYRILKKDGIFFVNTIHYSSRLGWEPAHSQAYSVKFLRQMMEDDITEADYYNFIQDRKMGKLFTTKRINFKWINDEFVHLGTEKWGIVKKSSNKIISYLANLNPYFCDRVWCYWVGGFDLIEGEFIK